MDSSRSGGARLRDGNPPTGGRGMKSSADDYAKMCEREAARKLQSRDNLRQTSALLEPATAATVSVGSAVRFDPSLHAIAARSMMLLGECNTLNCKPETG